jgi:hypothetical protein
MAADTTRNSFGVLRALQMNPNRTPKTGQETTPYAEMNWNSQLQRRLRARGYTSFEFDLLG